MIGILFFFFNSRTRNNKQKRKREKTNGEEKWKVLGNIALITSNVSNVELSYTKYEHWQGKKVLVNVLVAILWLPIMSYKLFSLVAVFAFEATIIILFY